MNSLAELAGVPASTISRIEAGRIEPTFVMLNKIAEAAGYSLSTDIEETGGDRPIVDYLQRLKEGAASIEERPAKELLAVASLVSVPKRAGARRLELPTSLENAVCKLSAQRQEPVVSSLEAFSGSISQLQSFIPVVYAEEPDSISGFEPATARSPRVMFVLGVTDNVRRNTLTVNGIKMVVPEWGIIDAMASPGRQADAALEALSTRKTVAA